MPLSDQDLLHGAALVLLCRPGEPLRITASIRSTYLVETETRRVAVMLKYSTKPRSPWQFTFSLDQATALDKLRRQYGARNVYLALVCHKDGVCCVQLPQIIELSVDLEQLVNVAFSVRRPRGGSYWLRGPGRVDLERAIPANRWPNELFEEQP